MMRVTAVVTAVLAMGMACCAAEEAKEAKEEGFVPLFDGTSLDGWKASENAKAVSVRDGMICLEGGRSHLFYVGDVEKHDFKSFELKADVMTTPGSNSGIYFHTAYLARGWPRKGMECQVNNSHRDRKRTGSLYNIVNVFKAPAKDNVWFEYHIIVAGKRVVIKIDGKVVMEYAETEKSRRKLSRGTFALQAHDPRSKVYYKNIRVKPLAD